MCGPLETFLRAWLVRDPDAINAVVYNAGMQDQLGFVEDYFGAYAAAGRQNIHRLDLDGEIVQLEQRHSEHDIDARQVMARSFEQGTLTAGKQHGCAAEHDREVSVCVTPDWVYRALTPPCVHIRAARPRRAGAVERHVSSGS